jgi:hypothetical protein
VAGNSSQNENMFLQKNLIGLLYYDPIADVCIYKTKHSFTMYLSILDISLVPHSFARNIEFVLGHFEQKLIQKSLSFSD